MFALLYSSYNLCLRTFFIIVALFTITVQSQQNSSDNCPSANAPQVLYAIAGRFEQYLTPGYLRGQYRSGLDCHYVIKASSYNNKIQVFIHDSQLEDRLFTDCDDFMELRDGNRNDSTLLARWCGYSNPLSITSTTNALYMRFKTDLFYENKGVNLSYTEYALPGCPPTWTTSYTQMMCYRLITPKPNVTWVQAQYHCNYDKSNLLTISSLDEYQTIFKAFSSTKQNPWIGISDAQEEGKFANVDISSTIWPNSCDKLDSSGPCFPLFTSHEDKDCLYLDFNQEAGLYRIDDCRAKRSFICKKRIDGTTVPYPPPAEAVKQGLNDTTAASFNPAIIVLIIVALFLILLIVLVTCVKNHLKKKTRVNVLENDNGALIANGNATSPQVVDGKKSNPMDNPNFPFNEETDLRKIIVPHSTTNGYANGNVSTSNGHAVNGTTKVFTLPPIDKFDRPPNCMLDNTSAISLDEFWQRLETEKYRRTTYPVSARNQPMN